MKKTRIPTTTACSPAAKAILRALQRGEAVGVRGVLRRMEGVGLCPLDTLQARKQIAVALRGHLDAGTVRSEQSGPRATFALTRKGRWKVAADRSRGMMAQACISGALGVAALSVAGCAAPRHLDLPSKPSMALPSTVGVQQVIDSYGVPQFEPCNPCAQPTLKSPVLGSYLVDEQESLDSGQTRVASRTSSAATKVQDEILGVLFEIPETTPQQAVQRVTVPAPNVVEPIREAAPVAPIAQLESAVAVLFDFSKSHLSREGRAAIATFALAAKNADAIYVRGNTDSLGTAAANEIVARNRAAVVKAALIAHGIPRERIKTSFCTTCFIAGNESDVERKANRRVDLSFTTFSPAKA